MGFSIHMHWVGLVIYKNGFTFKPLELQYVPLIVATYKYIFIDLIILIVLLLCRVILVDHNNLHFETVK